MQKFPFQKKWLADCEYESHKTMTGSRYTYTKIRKPIIFQFKLLHRRLDRSSFLKKLGKKQSGLCTFCKTETESLIHLFWSCGVTLLFWQEFKQWITTNNENVTSNFSPAIVFGFKPFFFSKKTGHNFLLTC